MTEPLSGDWKNLQGIPKKQFVCGHCGSLVGQQHGYGSGNAEAQIYICTFCNRPTFFERGEATPGAPFGEAVRHVGDEGVLALYEEARRCTATNAHTAAVLACRKILMHVAVSKGADEHKTFKEYVEYLGENYHIPKGSEPWVAYIKDKANEANHEIAVSDEKTAQRLLKFTGMLLKLVYEFPGDLKEGDEGGT